MSSQDNSDDDDDEATLREQLLKSLAVKRKAKLDVGVKYVKINLSLVQMYNDLCVQYQNYQKQVSVSLIFESLETHFLLFPPSVEFFFFFKELISSKSPN